MRLLHLPHERYALTEAYYGNVVYMSTVSLYHQEVGYVPAVRVGLSSQWHTWYLLLNRISLGLYIVRAYTDCI